MNARMRFMGSGTSLRTSLNQVIIRKSFMPYMFWLTWRKLTEQENLKAYLMIYGVFKWRCPAKDLRNDIEWSFYHPEVASSPVCSNAFFSSSPTSGGKSTWWWLSSIISRFFFFRTIVNWPFFFSSEKMVHLQKIKLSRKKGVWPKEKGVYFFSFTFTDHSSLSVKSAASSFMLLFFR